MIVCHCRVVTDRAIRAALDAGAGSLAAVCRATGAGTACGGCVFGVRAVIADHEAATPCPLHAVPALSGAPVGSSTTAMTPAMTPAMTTAPITEETDAAPQPARRRVA